MVKVWFPAFYMRLMKSKCRICNPILTTTYMFIYFQ